MDALRHAYDVLASSGMNEGLPADDVAKLLCASQRCADMSKRFKAYYLVEMDERRLYQTFGCSSTRHFAQQHMDQDHRRTGELLQVGRALLTLPAIDTAFCNHEISWSKLRSLVRVVVPKHEAAWLAKAKELSCKALSREVLLSKEGTAPRKPGQRKGVMPGSFMNTSFSRAVCACLNARSLRREPLGDAPGIASEPRLRLRTPIRRTNGA